MDQQALHEKILYPVVRVRTEKAGGSGSVIACLEDPDHEGEFQTFVLTNWHVIENAISTSEEWDSLLKKNRKVEVLQRVQVELFDYARMSDVTGGNARRADIVAYDKNHDLAVLVDVHIHGCGVSPEGRHGLNRSDQGDQKTGSTGQADVAHRQAKVQGPPPPRRVVGQ